MEAHSANILRKSGRGASREGGICSGRGVSRAGGICSGRSHPPDGAPVPAWSLSSGGPGIGSVRTVGSDEGRRGPSVPAGQAWSRCRFRTGRSHPPDARPPIFARSALRKGPDAPFSDSFCPFLQRPAAPEPTPFANPRFRRSGKAKKLFFYFYFIIKDVSLCSQNNTLSEQICNEITYLNLFSYESISHRASRHRSEEPG